AKGLVQWLAPKLAPELELDGKIAPLSADDLISLKAEGWLTFGEVLKIYTFSHAAATIERSLGPKVQQLRLKAEIPEEFEQLCVRTLPAALRACGPSLTLVTVFRKPPTPLAQAIGQVLGSYLSKTSQTPRQRLPGVRSIVFEHPSDRAALAALKAVPGVGLLTNKAVDFFNKSDAMALLGGAILATPKSLPAIYKILEEGCEILDVSPIPPLYVKFGPLESYTLGAKEPYIVLASTAVSLFTREELLFLLGHELGHIKAGHVPYHTLAKTMKDGAAAASNLTLGLSQLAFDATLSPVLGFWSRRSEYTADRAGFLVCQDQEAALRALMKLSGYPPTFYKAMHTRSIVAQAGRFRDQLAHHAAERFFTASNLWSASHPYTVSRAYELLAWLQESGGDILKMTRTELTAYAKLIDLDPHLAELQQDVIRTVADWAHENLQVAPSTARRLTRRMISGGASAKDTELQRILQIQFTLRKIGPDRIEHWVYLLINQNGKPVRVSLPMDRDTSWDALPDDMRAEFIRSGQTEINRELYTVN
ncbi:MAG: M48 family metallopeptidase, partial [Verrucomicrobiota bacterium]